jgi:hypothetical protein
MQHTISQSEARKQDQRQVVLRVFLWKILHFVDSMSVRNASEFSRKETSHSVCMVSQRLAYLTRLRALDPIDTLGYVGSEDSGKRPMRRQGARCNREGRSLLV